jgi:hypothetical protein
MKYRNERIGWAIAFGVLLVIEVLIALFVKDKFLRPYGGDILVVILLHCLVRIVWPRGIVLLPLWVFLLAAGVELLQLLRFINWIGLGDNALAKTLFGTTFSAVDLICYLVGCLLCAAFEVLRYRVVSKTRQSKAE